MSLLNQYMFLKDILPIPRDTSDVVPVGIHTWIIQTISSHSFKFSG